VKDAVRLQSIEPATGEVLAEYPAAGAEEIAAATARAQRAFERWRERPFAERSALLRRVAALLRERRETLARLMAREMGKPIVQGRSEIEKCASTCEHYAEHAERYLAPELIASDARRSFVAFAPLGVVLAIMPWNFPFWQVFRFTAPALMAGNACLLKHASNVCGASLAIEALLEHAGAPEGLFQSLLVPAGAVPVALERAEVRAVTLTGSSEAGRAVAAQAGALLKKAVLELGGSDPYVVLEDADLDVAVDQSVAGRIMNSGQSCIAAKRFIVPRSLLTRFEERVAAAMAAKRVGDPLEEATEIGPLARRDLRDALHRQVLASVERGARLLLGGVIPPGPGAYYPPSVLSQVRAGMPAYDEELFGPVAAIIPVENEREALRAANDSRYGLGAAVFTRDLERGERIAVETLEAGSCFVNAFVRSDPRLPFGGIKDSGYGRELGSFGIREFVNVKTVYVR
jgi:succinate-semialdehyde dehydrogenase / glutarate-semialdehyde dehydrogenase